MNDDEWSELDDDRASCSSVDSIINIPYLVGCWHPNHEEEA